jgi:hypothetical protein
MSINPYAEYHRIMHQKKLTEIKSRKNIFSCNKDIGGQHHKSLSSRHSIINLIKLVILKFISEIKT